MNNDEWQNLREKANNISDDQYASEASGIASLSKKQVSEIIKEAAVDKNKISELMVLVGDTTKTNAQKADAIKNGTGLAEVAVSLIGKLA